MRIDHNLESEVYSRINSFGMSDVIDPNSEVRSVRRELTRLHHDVCEIISRRMGGDVNKEIIKECTALIDAAMPYEDESGVVQIPLHTWGRFLEIIKRFKNE